MSVVWSCNEWDQLEEVIVGNPLRARFPTADLSTQLTEFPGRPLEKIPQGPFPQWIIDETEEDLNTFVDVLKKAGVTVRRPETWPHEANFPSSIGSPGAITIIARATLCWSSATTLSKHPTSCVAAPRSHSAIAR